MVRRRISLTVGALVAIASLGTGLGVAPAQAASQGSVAPNAVGMLDCNHLSTIQKSVSIRATCVDPHGPAGSGTAWGANGRAEDNGVYIGHDEPSITYLSSVPGSGNNVSLTETLPKEPAALPTVSTPGSDVTHTFELSPAPWISIDLCDPNSYPQLPCTPNSDSNASSPQCAGANPCSGHYPGAGAAFMELQFYPPGFAPFIDSVSCDNTHWCAALTVDSLECTFGFVNCNGACFEPINFAWIALNGVPAGPPSPQLATFSTLIPNANTLLMNPGDTITARLFNAPVPGGGGAKALKAVIADGTTGQTGYMQASAFNGFMNTSIVDCSGTPFNYQPEYSTAKATNSTAWTALYGNINTQFEIGHFEPCTSVTGAGTLNFGGGHTDTYFTSCAGPYETAAPGGDGPSVPEVSDALCYPAGDTHPGLGSPSAPDEVAGCQANFAQNGDLDFDGTPYWADWPNSTTPNNFPSTFLQHSLTTNGGSAYSQFEFQTDVALSESTCSSATLSGCAVPPPNAPGKFYPFWTLTSKCLWEFGNNTNGNSYGGKSKEYGTNQLAKLAYPEFISAVHANTCGR